VHLLRLPFPRSKLFLFCNQYLSLSASHTQLFLRISPSLIMRRRLAAA
jgi:hypothetical protein